MKGHAYHNAGWMQIVVQRVPLSQEFRRKQYLKLRILARNMLGVANGHSGLDDNARLRFQRIKQIKHTLYRASIEVILRIVVVRRGRYHHIIGLTVTILGLARSGKVQLARSEKLLYLFVGNRRFTHVHQIDFLPNDINRTNLVPSRKQARNGEANVPRASNSYPHTDILNIPRIFK